RQKLVDWSEAKAGDQILDVATGTGDLALLFKKQVGETGRVIGSDFCKEMLDLAPPKAQKQNLAIEFQQADAMDLPFDSNQFDVVSIAYGIRNVADPAKAVQEMIRVLKPGGRLMILETGDQQNPIIQKAFQLYFSKIVPWLGKVATGQKQAYVYLNQSSLSFPAGKSFCQWLGEVGDCSDIQFKSLMGGASFLYRVQV
ncbi:MAG: ubiquinone/menaquinone biosynthesis methyltransferase, partial [Bdellovibrionales bacterium]|nr:ubiquinone/menaquinone biosynthesis methyltransferase [Bdellovibrionales bacterium]